MELHRQEAVAELHPWQVAFLSEVCRSWPSGNDLFKAKLRVIWALNGCSLDTKA